MSVSGEAAPLGLLSLKQRLLARLTAQRDLRTVVAGAAQVLAIRMVGALLAYVSMALLARWLGTFHFGIYAYVWVCIVTLGMALPLGYNTAVLRFVPDYMARARWSRVRGYLRVSFATVVLAGISGALLGALLLWAGRSLFEAYYFTPMLIGVACMPLAALLGQMEATARAFGTVHLAYAPNYIVRPLVVMVAIGVIVWLRGRPTAEDALWAVFAACLLAVAGQGALLLREKRRHVRDVRPVYHTRAWASISFSFLMIEGFRMVLENADVLLLGRLLDPHMVGIYYAAIRTGGLIAFIYFAVAALAVPRFAQIHATGTREEMQRFVSGIIKLMFWPSLAAAAALAVVGPFALALFGPGFESGYPVLLIVLTGLVVRSATGPVEYLLNMTGHQMDTVRVWSAAATASIVLNLVLIPRFGMLGAAAATYGSIVAANLALCVCVRRRLRVTALVLA
jgi:O-antigen/teichoic acid export membrane protein